MVNRARPLNIAPYSHTCHTDSASDGRTDIPMESDAMLSDVIDDQGRISLEALIAYGHAIA
jgi:hypothetical protein